VLSGPEIRLQGGARAEGYEYSATYQGRIEGPALVLTGAQVWYARALPQPFRRGCRITLARSC